MRSAWALLILAALTEAAVDYSNNTSVQLFQQYIQINTTSGNDFSEAVVFWQTLAAEQNVSINVYEFTEGKPVLVIKWPGTNSSLSSIMLNSHMDVVPADESDGWTYPPFSGYLTDDGDIWGRGTQDMKSVSIQYYEALSRLKANNVSLLRDVYMTLMPDEEVGGGDGMVPFVESDEFAALNVGFELDEGTSIDLPIFAVFYQDKAVWQISVECNGTGGHGSVMLATNDTAAGKCRNVIDSLLDFRDEQYEIAAVASITDSSGFTSVNLNIMKAGTANNVVPTTVTLVFDIRLKTSINQTAFQEQLEEWIALAGDNVTITYLEKDVQSPATLVSTSNPYWSSFASVASSLNITIAPVIPPGATDARYLRGAGIPAFGFSPMANTPLLLHSVDEYLPASTFLTGIDIYEQLIKTIANLSASAVSTQPSTYLVETAG